jgi:hypothetical protein
VGEGRAAGVEVEQAVYQQLARSPILVAFVDERIYPDSADPDAPRPLVVYRRDATEGTRSLSGSLDFQRHTVSVYVDSLHKDEGKAIAAAVKAALDGSFAGAQRGYWADESADDTGDGYESVQTFTVIQ